MSFAMAQHDDEDTIARTIRRVFDYCPEHGTKLVPMKALSVSAPARLVCPEPECTFTKNARPA